MSLSEYVKRFNRVNAYVVGDLMLDRYEYGAVRRISPEAPAPILEAEGYGRIEHRLGGAANVANNLAALGARTTIGGRLGDDEYGKIFRSLAEKDLQINQVYEPGRGTITKVRFFDEGHELQVFRLDKEGRVWRSPLAEESFSVLMSPLTRSQHPDIVVLSDYNKGVFRSGFGEEIIFYARQLNPRPLIAVGPRPANIESFAYADLICLNLKEASDATGIKDKGLDSVEEMAKNLEKRTHSPNIVITCGKEGMLIYEKNAGQMIATRPREVYDVTGAGDTTLAAIALSLASGASLSEAARIANEAAGIAVSRIGTTAVGIDDLVRALEQSQ